MKKVCAALCLFAVLLSSCSMGNQNEPQVLHEDYISNLKNQIVLEKDDFLRTAENAWSLVTFDCLYTGNFSSADENELLVLFYVDAPHVGGLDRKIACVYDSETLLLKQQETFSGDANSIRIYKNSGGRDYILRVGSVTNQGVSAYSAELFEVASDGVHSIPLSDTPLQEDEAASIMPDGQLAILSVQLDNYNRATYALSRVLHWNSDEGMFTPKDEGAVYLP